jgi:hypothetical protein
MDSQDTGITIVGADTGVGKNHSAFENLGDNFIVATPTHRLKAEGADRFKEIRPGIECLQSLPRPKCPGSQENGRYSPLEKLGFHEMVLRELHGYAHERGQSIPGASKEEEDRFRKDYFAYERNCAELKSAPRIFTTHSKAMFIENARVKTYVWDEDPLQKWCQIRSTTGRDVRQFLGYLKGSAPTAKDAIDFLTTVLWTRENCVCPVPPGLRLDQDLCYKFFQGRLRDNSGPVHLLLEADHWVIDDHDGIHFITIQKPRPDVKHIVLSATANPYLYKHIFGDAVQCEKIPPTQPRGQLFQHPDTSYSKQCIEKDPDAFARKVVEDRSDYGFDGIITHKEYVAEAREGHVLRGTNVPVFTWFGALEGLDSFSGRSLAVYGTPNRPQHVYQLFGAACGIDVDPGWTYQDGPVRRNGWEFPFHLYTDNPYMHGIQLGLVESEIAQAVGRARLVSQDTTVHLYSRILLRGGELISERSRRLAA